MWCNSTPVSAPRWACLQKRIQLLFTFLFDAQATAQLRNATRLSGLLLDSCFSVFTIFVRQPHLYCPIFLGKCECKVLLLVDSLSILDSDGLLFWRSLLPCKFLELTLDFVSEMVKGGGTGACRMPSASMQHCPCRVYLRDKTLHIRCSPFSCSRGSRRLTLR